MQIMPPRPVGFRSGTRIDLDTPGGVPLPNVPVALAFKELMIALKIRRSLIRVRGTIDGNERDVPPVSSHEASPYTGAHSKSRTRRGSPLYTRQAW